MTRIFSESQNPRPTRATFHARSRLPIEIHRKLANDIKNEPHEGSLSQHFYNSSWPGRSDGWKTSASSEKRQVA